MKFSVPVVVTPRGVYKCVMCPNHSYKDGNGKLKGRCAHSVAVQLRQYEDLALVKAADVQPQELQSFLESGAGEVDPVNGVPPRPISFKPRLLMDEPPFNLQFTAPPFKTVLHAASIELKPAVPQHCTCPLGSTCSCMCKCDQCGAQWNDPTLDSKGMVLYEREQVEVTVYCCRCSNEDCEGIVVYEGFEDGMIVFEKSNKHGGYLLGDSDFFTVLAQRISTNKSSWSDNYEELKRFHEQQNKRRVSAQLPEYRIIKKTKFISLIWMFLYHLILPALPPSTLKSKIVAFDGSTMGLFTKNLTSDEEMGCFNTHRDQLRFPKVSTPMMNLNGILHSSTMLEIGRGVHGGWA